MRLFFGLGLPKEAQSTITSARLPLSAQFPDLAWIRPESYHITLSFLGEQGSRGLAAARRALAVVQDALLPGSDLPEAMAGRGRALRNEGRTLFKPIRAAAYPLKLRAWRVLVLEAEAKSARPIVLLRDLLGAALAEEAAADGLPPLDPDWNDLELPRRKHARSFSPHLSLARVRRDRKPPDLPPALMEGFSASLGEIACEGWPLGALSLYKSELRPGGAVYSELGRVELAESEGYPSSAI